MKFVITNEKAEHHDRECYQWTFQLKDGEAVCASAKFLRTEAEARSDIAAAKTSMKGARFAKVTVQ